MGTEYWFSFEATEETTTFVLATETYGAYVITGIFDETGKHIDAFNTQDPRNTYLFDTDTVVGKRYYVGAVSAAVTMGEISIPSSDFTLALKKMLYTDVSLSDPSASVYSLPTTGEEYRFAFAPSATAEMTFTLKPGVSILWNGAAVTGSTVSIAGPGEIILTDGTNTQKIPVMVTYPSELSLGYTWTTVSLQENETSFFVFPVSAGLSYTLAWETSDFGNWYLSARHMATDQAIMPPVQPYNGSGSEVLSPSEDGYILVEVDLMSYYSSGFCSLNLRVIETL